MYDIFRTALFRLDPEQAHYLAACAARSVQFARAEQALKKIFAFEDARLEQTLWGHTFPSPVGLAAGFDKNASLAAFWHALGFGFAEIGSVTAWPSRGNPRPRAFRLIEDEALVNRMGLNNKGVRNIARRLRLTAPRSRIPLGINIASTHGRALAGNSAVEDFRLSFKTIADQGAYVALNISCPNTPDGKTFEDPGSLEILLKAIMEQRRESAPDAPVLLKLPPPVSDQIVFDSGLQDIVRLAREYGVTGFVAANTAPDREGLAAQPDRLAAIGRGGLSGRPLESRATHLVRHLYRLTEGAMPIIGVGGVFSAEDAYRKIRAGASLVQLYTALVYRGPDVVREIKTGLAQLLERDGLDSVADAVGADAA